MNKIDYKKFILGPFGAGLLLIILQFLTGIKTNGNIPYLIGSNILLVLGIASIIDSIIELKNRKYTQLQDANIRKKNSNKNYQVILIIMLLFSISLNLFQLFNPKIKVEEKIIKEKLECKIDNDIKQKLEFYDDHVVIVPTDTNYYMTYDLYKQTTYDGIGGRIFNTESAIAQGYKEYTLYNAIIDGTYTNQ